MPMKKQKKLMEYVIMLFEKHGQKAFEKAKTDVLKEKMRPIQVHKAICYFMEESWHDVQHPALMSLTCEAVGGNPAETIGVSAGIVLLAGAADIHDDVIDCSKVKNGKLTVFGKFGKDIAVLVGDALLFKGLTLLYNACEKLSKDLRESIPKLVEQAFFEIGSAEALETELKKEKYNITPEEYYSVIEAKAGVADTCAKIGALLGGGSTNEVNMLGQYGRTLGILMEIRNDFIDLFDPIELKNRVKNECLPFPLLYAFQNLEIKYKIVQLLSGKKITNRTVHKLLNLVMDLNEVQKLKEKMKNLIDFQMKQLHNYNIRIRDKLSILLQATIEDL
jgi:geranylgeranyl pyrophosphate synthase